METSISKPIKSRGWVQTERSAHEIWARFTLEKGGATASALMHNLCALMDGGNNAVVISQAALAKLLGDKSIDTIQRAIKLLKDRNFIQVVRIGRGKEAAYVVNDRVAWASSRDRLRMSSFSATIVADVDDQDAQTISGPDLHRIPVVFPGEQQLATGDGMLPPSQPFFDGMEPDLPAIKAEA